MMARMGGCMDLQQICQMRYGRELRNCSNEEIYYALLEMVRSLIDEMYRETGTFATAEYIENR